MHKLWKWFYIAGIKNVHQPTNYCWKNLVLFHRILYAYDYQIIAVSITIKGIKLALASRVNEVVDMTWHDTTCPKTKLAEHLFREKKKINS